MPEESSHRLFDCCWRSKVTLESVYWCFYCFKEHKVEQFSFATISQRLVYTNGSSLWATIACKFTCNSLDTGYSFTFRHTGDILCILVRPHEQRPTNLVELYLQWHCLFTPVLLMVVDLFLSGLESTKVSINLYIPSIGPLWIFYISFLIRHYLKKKPKSTTAVIDCRLFYFGYARCKIIDTERECRNMLYIRYKPNCYMYMYHT